MASPTIIMAADIMAIIIVFGLICASGYVCGLITKKVLIKVRLLEDKNIKEEIKKMNHKIEKLEKDVQSMVK